MYKESSTAKEWLAGQPNWLRYAIGLILIAIISIYIPHLLIALSGRWGNNLTMYGIIAGEVALMMIQGLIGLAFRRPLLVGAVFAAAWFLFFAWNVAATERLADWRLWWAALFLSPAASLLNGWLMSLYKRMANLS